MTEPRRENGTLYLVAVPIGNPGDITERALKALRDTAILYCEELKEGRRLLAAYGLRRELRPLNEHTENETIPEIMETLASGRDVAFFSDCGTPVFADPGFRLVQEVRRRGLNPRALPGASSLMTALTLSPFPIERFLYLGFLPREREARREELSRLIDIPQTAVLLDTPYRLRKLAGELREFLGREKRVCFLLNLTADNEECLIGYPAEVEAALKHRPGRAEFIVLIEPNGRKERIGPGKRRPGARVRDRKAGSGPRRKRDSR